MRSESSNILIVEDEPAHAEAIRRALEDARPGLRIRVARSLAEFHDLSAAEIPDLAIMDLNLPDGRAVEVLTAPPESGPFPILLMTSYGDERIAVEAMRAGALDYLVKSQEAFAAMPHSVDRALREWHLIRERHLAMEALKDSEIRFRLLFDRAPLGYQSLDIDGYFLDVNQAWLDTLGYAREEVIGRWFGDFLAPEYRDAFRTRFPIFKAAGKIHSEFEMIHQNGSRRHIAFNGRIGYGLHGEFKQTHCILKDITEQKRAEETIQASLREKEVLLREIHHRVKNNMQVISSLFNLQANHTLSAECRRILKESQNRIRAMGLVHEKLYQSSDLSKIDLAAYIQSLAVHLFHVYLVDPDQIRLETVFGEVALDINSAVPCGLILNELISNALQHAFPESRKGSVRIELKRALDGAVILRVADDGIGFPKDVDFCKTEGFGLQIVNLLAGQLEATFELDRAGGTAFTVMFREAKYAPRI